MTNTIGVSGVKKQLLVNEGLANVGCLPNPSQKNDYFFGLFSSSANVRTMRKYSHYATDL